MLLLGTDLHNEGASPLSARSLACESASLACLSALPQLDEQRPPSLSHGS